MDPFSNSPAHCLRSAYLRMHRISNRIFRPFGVTADQYVVLRLLAERDGISQQELVSQCASDPTTIGRMLDLLQEKEFIQRRAHASDRRTRLVFLTVAGQAIVEELYAAAAEFRDTIESAVSEATMKAMLRGLSQLSQAFEEHEQASAQAVRAGNGV